MEAPTFTDLCSENSSRRITGGFLVDITKIPYQVALRRSISDGYYWFTFCGGIIVTLNYVLSAAHCFVTPQFNSFRKNIRAVAGTVRSQVSSHTQVSEHWRQVKNYYYHQNYDKGTLKHDVAVLQLADPFIESLSVMPIRMHSRMTAVSLWRGRKCAISGYGKNAKNERSMYLQMGCVPLIAQKNCSDHYGANFIPNTVICAGGNKQDVCEGDSGGPLVCGGVLVGIISWGGVCGSEPGVYARVSRYTNANRVPFNIILPPPRKEDFTKIHQKLPKKPEANQSRSLVDTPALFVVTFVVFINK